MEDSFGFVPPTSVLAPAIMAVAAVNVVIVAYVIKAFRCFIMCNQRYGKVLHIFIVLSSREENVKEKNKTD